MRTQSAQIASFFVVLLVCKKLDFTQSELRKADCIKKPNLFRLGFINKLRKSIILQLQMEG